MPRRSSGLAPTFRTSLRTARRPIVRMRDAKGTATISGIDPFIMNADGKGWIFAPNGLLDGPLPTHYEPQESIVQNPLYAQQSNPARMEWRRADNPYAKAWRSGVPLCHHDLSTHRTPHRRRHDALAVVVGRIAAGNVLRSIAGTCRRTRPNKWRLGHHFAPRAREIEARVLVTQRFRPLRIKGRVIHQIGLPYHWGSKGLVTRGFGQRSDLLRCRSERLHPGVKAAHRQHPEPAASQSASGIHR